MSSRRLPYCIEDEKRGGQEFLEAPHNMPDVKLIAKVQVCLSCGREFTFKQGRKRCPRCFGPIRIKTVVLEAP